MQNEMNDKCKCLYIITTVLISMIMLARNTGRRVRYICEKRRGVLFAGLSGAGKTQLFNQLMQQYYKETPSSIQEEIGDYITQHGAELGLVDLPGRPDLRQHFFNMYRKCARAILFVIDSVTVPACIKEIADALYVILLDTEVRYKKLPILIVCNKQDMDGAMSHMAITTMLEQELTAVREATVNMMSIYDPYLSRYNSYLGKRNEDFKFSYLDNRVEIVDCSALPIDNCFTYMDDVKSWLNQMDELNIKY